MQVAHEQHHRALTNSQYSIYLAYRHFSAQLSSDWAVRTEDPWEANAFFVPALALSAARECSSSTSAAAPAQQRGVLRGVLRAAPGIL